MRRSPLTNNHWQVSDVRTGYAPREHPDSFGNIHRTPPLPDASIARCRTLADMTAEEVAAIEKQYGCRVSTRSKEPDHACATPARPEYPVCAAGMPAKRPGAGPANRAGNGYARSKAKRRK